MTNARPRGLRIWYNINRTFLKAAKIILAVTQKFKILAIVTFLTDLF
jgi:hypothetical protein